MLLALASPSAAQELQNRPYTDLRKLHFGIFVGTHLMDVDFNNVGPTTITDGEGNTYESTIALDQDRWDPGLTVGVLAELRLNQWWQFRVAPGMMFNSRHLTFRNLSKTDSEGRPLEEYQDLKTAYFMCAFDIIGAAPRVSNHRPYLMAGLNPVINVNGNSSGFVKLKKADLFVEAGVGCDFYLPYFKLRPELKFMYGLGNCLDTKHPDRLRDDAMLPYARSVDKAKSKAICLTFYFE